MDKLQIFLKNLFAYLRQPEMVSFWVFLGLLLAVTALNVIFLPKVWAWFSFLVLSGAVAAIFAAGWRLARTNLENRIKNREVQQIVENLNDGIIIYDVNFRILRLNQAAEEILKIKSEEAVGRSLTPALAHDPRLGLITQIIFPSLAPAIKQVSGSEEWPQIMEISFDNPSLDIHSTLNRIFDKNNKLIGFLKIIKDKTREKAILKEKNEFISVAAHQLRTPLTAIDWALESLAKDTADSPQKTIIDESHRVAERALKIINDLLDVSRIEEGRFDYNFTEAEINSFIKNLVLSAKPIADHYGIKLLFSPLPRPLKLKIDQNRVGLVLANLIDNAIKYNIKNGEVSVSLEELPDRPFVKVSVRDTGIGIAEKDLSQLFQKFKRGNEAAKLEQNGSGLGLYISKNIVERHGGEIGAESIIQRGSLFYFTLPTDPRLIPSRDIIDRF